MMQHFLVMSSNTRNCKSNNTNVSGSSIVFDVYIPALELVFEYNGVQHYQFHILFGDVHDLKERDNERSNACRLLGISIVEVPFSWKHDKAIITYLALQNILTLYFRKVLLQ